VVARSSKVKVISSRVLIVEWVYEGTDTCEVNLPSEFDYYERSWSLGMDESSIYSPGAYYKVDGATIKSVRCDRCTFEGNLTVSQLSPDEAHIIEIHGDDLTHAYGGLALIYGAP
jgi:hypothetical protein